MKPRISAEGIAIIANGGKNFAGLNIESANLDGMLLTGASFANASAHSATFNNAQGQNADFTGALAGWTKFNGAKMPGATFSGPGIMPIQATNADFSGSKWLNIEEIAACDFSSSNFNGARLENVKLRDCNFNGCDFQRSAWINVETINCTFDGANFSGANVGGLLFQAGRQHPLHNANTQGAVNYNPFTFDDFMSNRRRIQKAQASNFQPKQAAADLERFRQASGLTQAAFCEQIGLPIRTYQEWTGNPERLRFSAFEKRIQEQITKIEFTR